MSLAWWILIASGMLECVWATALDASRGFRRPVPAGVFLLAFCASTAGLSVAMNEIPVGTAYAVWVGIGAVLTAGWAMLRRRDRPTVLRVVLLIGLIACVAGLKAVGS